VNAILLRILSMDPAQRMRALKKAKSERTTRPLTTDRRVLRSSPDDRCPEQRASGSEDCRMGIRSC
jgi:hypothetical protein